MKQNKQKTTHKQAQKSFWQQEVSFDLKKSPVLNFLKQDIEMDISKSPVIEFMKRDIEMDITKSPVVKFLNKEIETDLKKSPVMNFLNKKIETDLTKSPVLNFCKQEVTLGGFADVSASPVLNWFKPLKLKAKNVKVAPDEIVVKAIHKDMIVSCLLASVLINAFVFISWLYYQVEPAAREAIVQMIFG